MNLLEAFSAHLPPYTLRLENKFIVLNVKCYVINVICAHAQLLLLALAMQGKGKGGVSDLALKILLNISYLVVVSYYYYFYCQLINSIASIKGGVSASAI